MLKALKNIIIGARIVKAEETINIPDDISEAEAKRLIDEGYLEDKSKKKKKKELKEELEKEAEG